MVERTVTDPPVLSVYAPPACTHTYGAHFYAKIAGLLHAERQQRRGRPGKAGCAANWCLLVRNLVRNLPHRAWGSLHTP